MADLSSSITQLAEKLDKILTHLNKTSELGYLDHLTTYKSNPIYSPHFLQGTYPPLVHCDTRKEILNCYQNDGQNWPHLFHTMDPQLNTITCMLCRLIELTANSITNDILAILDQLKDIIKGKGTEQSDQIVLLKQVSAALNTVSRQLQCQSLASCSNDVPTSSFSSRAGDLANYTSESESFNSLTFSKPKTFI